jgi:hypothetical protein
MAYNKEQFNTSSQPFGAWIFKGENLGQEELESMQREWMKMFQGIKGLWRTPFLQFDARWQPIRPPNKDMEFNQYLQILAGWMCAVYGIDSSELGFRFNQSGNIMGENVEQKLVYSKDRGLKDLLFFISKIINVLIDLVPEWDRYRFTFTGIEGAKDQKAQVEIDDMKTRTYLTINELRAEKDLDPIENGDVLRDSSWLNLVTQKEMMKQSEGSEEEAPIESEEKIDEDKIKEMTNDMTFKEKQTLGRVSDKEIEEAVKESVKKSKDDDDEFVTIEI